MPLTRWTHYRQTRDQKKKALHMLTLSGVVRPSTLELRYAASPLHNSIEPFPTEQPDISQNTLGTATHPSPMSHTQTSHLAHQLYSTTCAFLAESRRCIQKLQWDNRKAA